MSVRYAVYLAPSCDTPLWRFGSSVVGYDAETGADCVSPDLCGFAPEDWRGLTEEPRRYGFHGTLKAPFRLAPGVDETDLFAALAGFAMEHHPFELPPLEVRQLGSFIALVPPAPVPALMDLAQDAVEKLGAVRAPLSEAEIARRKPDTLTPRQRAYLHRYGYPYVREEFRFHMTLTGKLAEPAAGHAVNALSEAYLASGARMPVPVDDVVLYMQEEAGARFRILHRAPLGA